MILTGRDVQLYIASGKLKIDPIAPEQFQQNGVDLILQAVDQPCGPTLSGFHLACTREVLTLPDDLMAFVCLRSTYARLGILLPSTVVDAGFSGNLTLEIFATRPVLAPYGERFAHLVFARLTGPAALYAGKYQGQWGITPALPDP